MSIAHWREREKEQRQNDILSTAEKLFFRKGYHDVSMNDIAKEVGLGKSTLYFYFNNKEELFLAIILRGIRILSAMIKEAVEKEETYIKKLSSFKDAYNDFALEYPGYYWTYKYFQSGRFDYKGIADVGGKVEDVDGKVTEMRKDIKTQKVTPESDSFTSPYLTEILELRRKIFAVIYDSIKEGINDGTFRQDIDPAETTVMLNIITEGVQNIRPDLIRILENHGISQEEFESDSKKFIRYILLKK